jgi:hypothetical protein
MHSGSQPANGQHFGRPLTVGVMNLYLANVSRLTVGVADALWPATGYGVRLGDEAALAAADGVAGQVEGADRARAAGRGLARVWPHHAPLVRAHVAAGAVGVPAKQHAAIHFYSFKHKNCIV